MKLTDIKLTAHNRNHPSLYAKGKDPASGDWSYFPHVHVGTDTCSRPRFYRTTSHSFEAEVGGHRLASSSRNHMVINESGDYHAGKDFFDAFADLVAESPRMLRLLKVLVTPGAHHSSEYYDAVKEAGELVDRLTALEFDGQVEGYGPYFNEDGTPYEEDK